MIESARFRIDELATQYSLHPDLRDVYVEGETDKAFLAWFLREADINSRVAIYPIDAVDVPANLVEACGEKVGEKGEVVALAVELHRLLPSGHQHVTCVADADYDYALRRLKHCPLLVYTDGTCLEMYACAEWTIDKFLQVTLGGFRHAAVYIVAALTPIMISRFLARAANESLEWGMRWSDSLSGVRIQDNGSVQFDVDKFIADYLRQNSRLANCEQFRAKLDNLKQGIGPDIRQCIHRDDFAAVLCLFVRRWLRKSLRNRFNSPESVGPALRGCLEANKLMAEPMFATLVSRLS